MIFEWSEEYKGQSIFKDDLCICTVKNVWTEYNYYIEFTDVDLRINGEKLIRSRDDFPTLIEAKFNAQEVISLLHFALDTHPQKVFVFKGLIMGITKLDNMLHLIDEREAAIFKPPCPNCQGCGCTTCDGRGWIYNF